jgi:hypothetical protein
MSLVCLKGCGTVIASTCTVERYLVGIVGVLAEAAKRIGGLAQPLAVKTSRLWVIQRNSGDVNLVNGSLEITR